MGTKKMFEVKLTVRISADTYGEAVALVQERVEAGGIAVDKHAAHLIELSAKEAKG